jgi:hypothetical protein
MGQAPNSDAASQQLITYIFPPGSDFGGMLLGALQRIESGGAIRILDALFVARDDSGELSAVSMRSGSAGMIGELIGFRLDDASRKKQTEAALDGPARDLIRAIADVLGPGHAVAGVLVEHTWAQVLADAVARTGGRQLASEALAGPAADDAWGRVPAAVARWAGPPA